MFGTSNLQAIHPEPPTAYIMPRLGATFELSVFTLGNPWHIFGTFKRRFPSWSTANATDLSALVGGLLGVLSEAQQSEIAHEASRIKFSNGAENIQKKKPVEGTHTLSAVNLADSLTSWHEFMNNHACYPGCFLVTRKQDDITVVCAWATNLDMSSGNTTKCHVLFLYFGGFSCSYLEK